ncbi:Ran GTPase-binding protein LOS1 KNAG_0G00250 [Huiozyma naganishii CBS 8797]|uniref:Exportin-T n=1 Tax=Huiozyma naganishii (strain ATCC MYA-139 / BCRC 22969 / CBS 8797 / KCTC 17520 / NBRC 10181 / NCYC 3082 / Yp74L-3) TaxID=1071383 RepID=J7RNG0_HUIN7|nr:hypothetical protein KNAG_0G00250 [Kazachstania naganishii CBS 8797]CCK71083.1 hypothetical protein KNAG_0G00250 [Kazachstania naganishii CBS 8797]
MLSRIREVIAIANSPQSDPATQKQALEYLDGIKQDPNAVEVFAALLTETDSDDLLKFVSLQALNDIVGINSTNSNIISFVKQTVLDLLRKKVESNVQDAEYLRNKIVDLLTKIFYNTYGEINGNQWDTFFQDIITLLNVEPLLESSTPGGYSPVGIDYFNRICLFINSEIADQTYVRSKATQVKNNSLKDTMRMQDINSLAVIWINTLKSVISTTQHSSELSEIAILTLSCIGSYILWIDVNLIINPECITIIYNFLDFPGTKIACSKCLVEIISKKMKPVEKFALLGLLNLTDKVYARDDDDIEITEQLARLASAVGVELSVIVEHCSDTMDTNPESLQLVTSADERILTQVAPLVLKFMVHEYDSVTQQCFTFIACYLSNMKKLFAVGGKPGSAVALASKQKPLDLQHTEFVNSLLRVIFIKMKIDESTDANDESQDEVDEFNETIRSKLKTFQESIAVINPAIYLESISTEICTRMGSTDWRDLELAIYQMHNLCESIRNNLFGVPKQDIASSQPSILMVKFFNELLNHSTLFQMDNSYIEVLFFELVVRHHNFLNGEKNEFTVLNIFCSEFGMFNKRGKVRMRTWYLFSRFLKITKPKFTVSVLTEIIRKITPLLDIKIDEINSDGIEEDTVFSNQMYLFEGIGILIGANADAQYSILDEVLIPMFTDLERCISSQVQSIEVVLQCHHILMAVGTLARGVQGGLVPENQVNNTLVNKKLIHQSLTERFANITEVVLVTFSYFNKHENIRDASRFTFSRLIPILNNDIVPFANKLIALFLESDLKIPEMNDFLGFIGQMVHVFHKEEGCFELFTNLVTPLVAKVHQIMELIDNEQTIGNASNGLATVNNHEHQHAKNIIVTDAFRDKILLKKAYFAFLQSFVTNSVTSLLLNPNNGNTLSIILLDLLSYTPGEVQESSTMKLSLNVLVNFIRIFGSGLCNDANDIHAKDIQKIEGLNAFLISKVVPLVFEIPFNAEYNFNVKEGSSRVIACDLSRLLRELYLQSGAGSDINSNPSLKYLSEIYLPQIQFPPQLNAELLEMLVTSDQKSFEKYYVSLIDRVMF